MPAIGGGQHSLEEQFNAAVEIIQNLPKEGPIKPTVDDKLKTYALFKQVTLGPCTKDKPSFFHVIDRLKYNAYKELGEMSKEEAMAIYVDNFLERCDKAESDYDIMDFLTDPKWSQYLHLEPMFRKNFAILGRTTVKGHEGKVINYNGVQIQL